MIKYSRTRIQDISMNSILNIFKADALYQKNIKLSQLFYLPKIFFII